MIIDAQFPPPLKIKAIDNDRDIFPNLMSWLHFFFLFISECDGIAQASTYWQLLLITRSFDGLLSGRNTFFKEYFMDLHG